MHWLQNDDSVCFKLHKKKNSWSGERERERKKGEKEKIKKERGKKL